MKFWQKFIVIKYYTVDRFIKGKRTQFHKKKCANNYNKTFMDINIIFASFISKVKNFK